MEEEPETVFINLILSVIGHRPDMIVTGFLALALLAALTVDEQLHRDGGTEVGSSQSDGDLQRGQLADEDEVDVAIIPVPRLMPLEYPYQRPCQNKSGNEEEDHESDLCAQWTAAEAATDSVGLTFWQNIIAGISVALSFLGVCLVVWSLSIARKANEHAGKAVRTASEGLALAKVEFEQRMRPSCSILGISLTEDWIESIRRGSDLPIVFHVENLGGSTARHVEIAIRHFRVMDHQGDVLLDQVLRVEVPPIRVSKPRRVEKRVPLSSPWPTAHSIGIIGLIGFRGNRIAGLGKDLVDAEHFYWIDNPENRSSTELVEREQPRQDDQG